MEKQTSCTLAYLLAQLIQNYKFGIISDGTMGVTAHQTVSRIGNSARGPVMHDDVIGDL